MPVAPATQPSIRVDWNSPYEGGNKDWSQRFHFTGPDLTTATFNTLADALVLSLRDAIDTRSHMTNLTGYNPGSDVPAFSKPSSQAGTYPYGPNWGAPLEMCGLMRFSTDQRTSKNHPIYLYKWWRGVQIESTGSADQLRVGLRASMLICANQLVAGLSDGTNTRKYCGPRGAVAQSAIVEQYLHGHDFPS